MLVDDNFFNIMMLQNFLKKNNNWMFNVTTATNGMIAIE